MYRIVRPPHGIGQWIAGLIACFCGFLSGMSLVWVATVYPRVQDREVSFTLTDLEKACVASFIHIGQMVGTIPSGFMQNALGRRCVLIIAVNFNLIAWAIIYFLQYVWAILIARIFMGFWIAFVLTCVPAYTSEIATPRVRGRVSGMVTVFATTGFVFQSTTAAYQTYEAVALTSFAINFVHFISLLNIPESIYSLIRSNKIESAAQGLRCLRGKEDVTEELARIKYHVDIQMTRSQGFIDIFKWPASRKAFYQAVSLVLVQRMCGYQALSSYSSIILPDSWIESERYPMVWTSINLIMLIISINCVDYVDRKVLLLISSIGCSIFAMLATVWFFLYEYTSVDLSETLWLPMLFVSIHTAFYAFGLLYIPVVFQGEVFPINIKSKAASVIAFIGFGASLISVQIFIPLQVHFGNCSNFLLFTVASVIGCFISRAIVETRRRPLEEIQSVLEGRSSNSKINAAKV